MALTNFSTLTQGQKTTWGRDLWKMARNQSFIFQFTGKDSNSLVQRITELTKNEKGARAILHLLADLEGDGVMGDYTLEGNEEAIKAYDLEVTIDQMRHANRSAGKMTEQKNVIDFRTASRDVLAYWLADRLDQMAFLTLAGVDYTQTNRGVARPVNALGQNLGDLEFASLVTAPSANRHLRVTAAGDITTGDTTAVAAADKLSYAALVKAKAFAKDQYIRGIKTKGNEEVYHFFTTPQGMANLKLDSDFLANIRSAGVRGDKNPLFAGSNSVMVDGIVVHEFRHVYNTAAATSGNRWGAASAIHGQRNLLCGAQALGLADLGTPEWNEDEFDYGNQNGISTGKILGLLKPKFHSNITGTVEDFGVVAVDSAY